VDWRDLVLDILITPDARCRVLDESANSPMTQILSCADKMSRFAMN